MEAERFNVVLLDINMPGLTGFELCEKLRQIPHCKSIPVIFITGHNNFDNRKQSVLSGGHDFITKPVSPSELALKISIHLLKTPAVRGPSVDAGNDTRTLVASKGAVAAQSVAPREVVPSTALMAETESATSAAAPEATPPGQSTGQSSQSTHTPVKSGVSAQHSKAPTEQVSEPVGSQSRSADELFQQVTLIVARIMFDDAEPTERNLRLVRIALENQKLPEILRHYAHQTQQPERALVPG
jgi:CheY-like chemotaxis protein